MFRNPNPYAAGSDLGVRPATALSVGFLTQAFGWMFAGLLLTAGVACVDPGQRDPRRDAPPPWLFLPLFIVQIALVVGDQRRGSTSLSATAALGLFFAYCRA